MGTSSGAPSRAVLSAASKLGLELHVLNASSVDDFDAAFAELTRLRAGGLLISGDAVFTAATERLAALTLRHGCLQSVSIANLL